MNEETTKLWNKVLGEMELQISRPNFAAWLKNSRILNRQDEFIVVGLPNNFAKEWVENKYDKAILGVLRSLDDRIKKVDFVIDKQECTTRNNIQLAKKTDDFQQIFDEFKIDPETNLNPQFQLKSFAVGSSNEMAYAAATAVLNSLGRKYNPLFIYGGVGVGKTHLIQGLGNEIKNRYRGKIKVLYTPSEKFTNDVIWAMRNKRMDTIKSKYRDVDVLIIDDIQFIGGKVRTEEEFFHTFNALYEQNKQIIISSDRSPRFIPTLEERLKSRFEAGMTVDITFPDFELKAAVLKMKLEEKGKQLNEKVVEFVANKVQKNLRELDGILNKILFYQDVKRIEVDVKLAESVVSSILKQPLKGSNPNQIIRTVANYFEIPVNDLVGKSRKQEIVEPRQIVIYLMREVLNLSYPYIANKLGNRDHTTAIYSYEKINKRIQEDQDLNQKIIAIKNILEEYC